MLLSSYLVTYAKKEILNASEQIEIFILSTRVGSVMDR